MHGNDRCLHTDSFGGFNAAQMQIRNLVSLCAALSSHRFIGGPVYVPFKSQRLPMFMQSEASECGLACIAMIASSHGAQCDLIALRRRFGLSLSGASLAALMHIADTIGLASRSVSVPLAAMKKLRTPAVLHWEFNHYVVLRSISGRSAVIHDPAMGVRKCSLEELSNSFTGIALELTPTDFLDNSLDNSLDKPQKFYKRVSAQNKSFNLGAIWRRTTGLGRTLVQLILLSIILQLFLILSPLYLQIVVDDVLPNFNLDLLTSLAIGFGLFTVLNALTEALRTFVLVHVGASLSFQFAADLFNHLTRLPLDYFEKRHVGGILSRFSSLDPIKDALIQGVASAFIDGVMLLVTLLLMLLYSPSITLLVILAFLLYTAVRLSLYHRLRSLSEKAIIVKAKEESLSIETLRAMLPLKIFCREAERRQQWQNLLANSISADAELARAQLWFSLANSLIFGLENIAVIFVGSSEVLRSSFTVGMLFAFLTYKRQFVDKSVKLIEVLIDFKMLGLHFERLADIKSTDTEPADTKTSGDRAFSGEVSLQDVSYAYSPDQGNTLCNINLTIPAGQRIAVVGHSGSGKTTLVKLLLGLLTPTTGNVLAESIPLSQYGLMSYRKSIAAVMQEDQLLAGSIADNISFFADAANIEFIYACAKNAAIFDDIIKMPMGFETLVGDMGSALSGGQKQRVLLARALYAYPSLLVLDEGTAHLDTSTERTINETLRELGITVISVAHREGTIRAADRVVGIAGGRIVSDELQTPYADDSSS
ncbi:MAG: peptidase domain-containing ABC transporter [Congregibacter sp.]